MSESDNSMYKGLVVILLIISPLLIFVLTNNTGNRHAEYYATSISQEQLESDIKANSSEIIYFYRADCPDCKDSTDIILGMNKKHNMNIKPYSTKDQPFQKYDITVVPTIIHFEDGYESERIEVKDDTKKEDYKKFLEKIKGD